MQVGNIYCFDKASHFLCESESASGYGEVGKRVKLTQFFTVRKYPTGERFLFNPNRKGNLIGSLTNCLTMKSVDNTKMALLSLTDAEFKPLIEWRQQIAKERIQKQILNLQKMLDDDGTLYWV